ncbi:MAG: hypothetical protein ACJ74J_18630 [Blastocatellia bacterium]
MPALIAALLRVASATLEPAGIQASLTRRDHRAVDFQALKRLAKLTRRYAASNHPPLCGVKSPAAMRRQITPAATRHNNTWLNSPLG